MKKKLIKFEDTLKSRIENGDDKKEISVFFERLTNSIKNEELDKKYSNIQHYSFRAILHSLGNLLIGRPKNLSDTVLGWKMTKYEILFREHRLYSRALDAGSWQEFEDETSFSNGTGFIEQVWSLCGLYYFAVDLDWPVNLIQYLDTAIVRGDIDFNLENNDEFPWLLTLVKFLYSDESRETQLEQLSGYERFNFVQTAWHDDGLFKAGLEGLCEWHIDKCTEAYRYGSFYPVEHYALFPVWIYALDKCRERELGRSALPDNPLMEYGEKVRSATYEHQGAPILEQLDDFYNRKYADNEVDFYEFWQEFKKT
jgi:hypothetical protein